MTLKDFCKANNLNVDVVKKRAKRYSDLLNGHISGGRISLKSEIDEYAADILNLSLKRSSPIKEIMFFAEKVQDAEKKELKEIIDEQKSIIERQSDALKEKERQIRKLESSYKLLEMKFGNIYRETFLYADKY